MINQVIVLPEQKHKRSRLSGNNLLGIMFHCQRFIVKY